MFYLLCRIINDAKAQGFKLKLFVKKIPAVLQVVLCLPNLLFTNIWYHFAWHIWPSWDLPEASIPPC